MTRPWLRTSRFLNLYPKYFSNCKCFKITSAMIPSNLCFNYETTELVDFVTSVCIRHIRLLFCLLISTRKDYVFTL